MHKKFPRLSILALSFLFPLSLLAQVGSTLLGTVTDSSGAAIPDADITIRNEGTGLLRNVTSGSDGAYLAAGLPLGVYTLHASGRGFSDAEVKGVTLALNQELRVSLTLAPAGVATVVEVQSEAVALVDTHEATLATTIDQTRIVELPSTVAIRPHSSRSFPAFPRFRCLPVPASPATAPPSTAPTALRNNS